MIGDLRVLAVVTARGGSKGVPGKNVAEVGGRPLIAWTALAAAASEVVDRAVVSTDDPSIADAARAAGLEVPFMRPADLARDDTPGPAPVLHAIETVGEPFDLVVLLQPTSPLRNGADIDACVRRCVESGAPACVSVSEPRESPYWMYTLDAGGRLVPFTGPGPVVPRRQDLPTTYALNGAVYVARVGWFLRERAFLTEETVACVMPPERSLEIDTPLDLAIVRAVFGLTVE